MMERRGPTPPRSPTPEPAARHRAGAKRHRPDRDAPAERPREDAAHAHRRKRQRHSGCAPDAGLHRIYHVSGNVLKPQWQPSLVELHTSHYSVIMDVLGMCLISESVSLVLDPAGTQHLFLFTVSCR